MSRLFGHPNNITTIGDIVNIIFNIILFIVIIFLMTISCNGLPRYITPPLTDSHTVTIENMMATRWTPMRQGALVGSVPFTTDLASHS